MGDFKWLENTSQISENFTENYNEKSDEGYFLETDVQYPERLYDLHQEKMKIKKVEKLEANLKKKIFHIHMKFKTSMKSWISFEKCLESLNPVRKLG